MCKILNQGLVDTSSLAGKVAVRHDEDSANEEPLRLECVLPIRGINWPVDVPVTISWRHFRSIVAGELNMEPDEIQLSYRFSSFTAADNAEVLCSQEHFQTMVVRAKEFLTGKRKVRGGREFRVHLDPVIKQPPPTTTEASASKKGKGKVSPASVHSVATF